MYRHVSFQAYPYVMSPCLGLRLGNSRRLRRLWLAGRWRPFPHRWHCQAPLLRRWPLVAGINDSEAEAFSSLATVGEKRKKHMAWIKKEAPESEKLKAEEALLSFILS